MLAIYTVYERPEKPTRTLHWHGAILPRPEGQGLPRKWVRRTDCGTGFDACNQVRVGNEWTAKCEQVCFFRLQDLLGTLGVHSRQPPTSPDQRIRTMTIKG